MAGTRTTNRSDRQGVGVASGVGPGGRKPDDAVQLRLPSPVHHMSEVMVAGHTRYGVPVLDILHPEVLSALTHQQQVALPSPGMRFTRADMVGGDVGVDLSSGIRDMR